MLRKAKVINLTREEVIAKGGEKFVKTLGIPTLNEMCNKSKVVFNFIWLPPGTGYRIQR